MSKRKRLSKVFRFPFRDQALSRHAAPSKGTQQASASSTPNIAGTKSQQLPRDGSTGLVHMDQSSVKDPVSSRPFTPKLTLRTNTLDSTQTLEPPEHGQAASRFQRDSSVRTGLGLNPGPYRPSPLRQQGIANTAQPLLEETPKLKQLFPLTIPVRCHIRFNTNHQLQRLLRNAHLNSVSAVDEDDNWSFETKEIDLPDQEIEWYKHDAYHSLQPKKHMQKITDGHPDVREESLYIRHGCFTVEGPPELRQNLKFVRFADVTELAQKSIHAICGFIHEHQYKRFHLDVHWEYSTLQLSVPPECANSSFYEIIKKGLESKLVTNFRGQEYIPRCDLVMFQQTSVIQNIISQDQSLSHGDRDGILESAVSRATHLLLMCVYNEQPMSMFKHLLEVHDIDDGKLEAYVGHGYPPIHDEVCQQDRCLKAIKAIRQSAPQFLPLKVGKDPRFKVWKNDMIIPLHFYDEAEGKPFVTLDDGDDEDITGDREIGRGANGQVLKIWAEPSLHSLPGSLKQTFALKKASNIRLKAFEAEKVMLEKLYDYPHSHITPHFGSWQQDDHTYILLPSARCNLRYYLTTNQPPQLKMTAVKWFFDQLYGLADAIKHVHHIKPAGTLMNPDPKELNFGYHHDIKPENILVFEKVAGVHPVLQISDFGAGSLYDADAQTASRPVDTVRGTRTYFAPAGEPATRPVDMWSLGCCFLELTLWLFGLLDPVHSEQPFTEERKYFPGHDPKDTDDGFWYRRRDGKIELKEPVINRIDSLRERYCKDMEVFQILLEAIRRPDGQRSLLTIDKSTRMDATTLVDCLDSIRKHINLQMRKRPAEDEDDLYARYFDRNLYGTEQALTPIDPFELRTSLTTNPPSSARNSFVEEEPTASASLQPKSGQRQRSTSSLVVQAGQGAEYQPQANGSSLEVNGVNGRAISRTPSPPDDSLANDLDRLQLET
ncbi:uncharacterized protein HMPREF1541_02285 [Cyphellophora europaea CBS 101466]|uniref:Protein kinase domain-containing protein n=1 Tax=Cyphellophora europaea (strain CBS 101466) TaxID=1220924 RepID=W2S356_CYPE1|nr:uncharacterized protein HMPREF1541_02285 [Cyphellophora europaea CBS 101466]ETN43127.1 hypothetical protein HMPREF1541_02285 [Cyphellophora europaea CBS 101466]